MKRVLSLLAALIIFALPQSARRAQAQEPNGQSDSDVLIAAAPERNPAGPWSYGYKPPGGTFTVYGDSSAHFGSGTSTWSLPGQPCCLMATKNNTGSTYTYPNAQSVVHPADLLNLHPGPAGERSVVRWTAPSSGTYTIKGRFQGIDTVGTTADVAVAHNGMTLFGGSVDGYGAQSPFMLTRIVAAGDVVEFSVGAGANGTYYNDSTGLAAAITFEGRASRSLSLDGAGSYVEVPSSESLNITGPLTVEAWVKINSSGRLRGIVERYNWLNTPDGGFALRLTADNKIQFHTVRSNTEAAGVQGGTSLSVGTWHHVAGVFDGGQIKVYVDGKLDGAVNTAVAPAAGTTSLKIGVPGHRYYGDTTNYFFDGLIDEVRVTAGAAYEGNFSPQLPLTASVIVRGGDGQAAARGYWDFESPTPDDSSGYDNHGSPVGGAGLVVEASDRQPQIIIQDPYAIDFNVLPVSALVTDQYSPRATFSSVGFSAGAGANWQPKPFVASTHTGFRSVYSYWSGVSGSNAELYVDFPTPVSNVSFRIINAFGQSAFTVCYIDVFQNYNYHGWYAVSTNGGGSPIQVNNFRHIPNVTGIRVRNVVNGMDWSWQSPAAIYYDDFNFTYPLNCPASTEGCPTPTPTPTPTPAATPTPTPTPEIKQVDLLPTTGEAGQLTANPNIVLDGGPGCAGRCGLRIFPDKRAPGDSVNRRRVQVRAVTSHPSGTPIFFRSVDVDDPSTNAGPVDTTGPLGDDNKTAGTGKAGTLSSTIGITDVNGIAMVTFDTTMQPGDNFRIVASTDYNYLQSLVADGIDVRESNGTGIPSGAVLPTRKAAASQMLTVWRRLHIEVDSMGVVSSNQEVGTITSRGYDVAANLTVLTIKQEPDKSNLTLLKPALENNRFENGRIQLSNVGGALNYASVVSNTSRSITVIGQLHYDPVGMNFVLWDDDDYDLSAVNGNLNGDDGQDIAARPETLSLIKDSSLPSENIFAHAYIQPDYFWAELSSHNQTNVAFKLNIADNISAIDTQLDGSWSSGTLESDGFWIVAIQLGYQHASDQDCDPNDEGCAPGVTLAYDTAVNTVNNSNEVPIGGDGSLIYIEVQRDGAVNKGNDRRAATVPHEIGHQMGLFGDNSSGLGVMSYGPHEPKIFVPQHINVLRWRVKSPGYQEPTT